MNMNRTAWTAALSILLGAGPVILLGAGQARAQAPEAPRQAPATQDPKPAPAESEPPKTMAELVRYLGERGVRLDPAAKTVGVDCVVGQPTEPVEYLLIHPRGKSHESILVAEVQPSVLNTALLALGYSEGKNARVVEKDPLPTLEEVRAGAPWLDVFPPEGQEIWITASWEFEGKTHSDVPVAELLQDETNQAPVRDHHWIFLGGNVAPLLRGEAPVFVGDYQGNIVSSCYMHPPNHLITITHERGNDEQNWWVTPLVPPTGTKMALKFWAMKPPTVVAREARLAKEKPSSRPSGSVPAAESRPTSQPVAPERRRDRE